MAMSRTLQILIAIDQLLNATVCGGWADETMSAHAFRLHRDGKPWGFMMKVIDTIFFWEPNHCQQAYESEVDRRQLPPAYRTASL